MHCLAHGFRASAALPASRIDACKVPLCSELEFRSSQHVQSTAGRRHNLLTRGCCVSRELVLTCSEEDWRRPLCTPDELQGRSGVILALGKFDAMHRGHRSLAEAAAALGGFPCLLSFWGMAEVLGLPPRKPLTPDADRPRVLQTWASHCGGLVPMQRNIPFACIRHLSPLEFVKVLADDLMVSGVITGENYRFGYKAAGDAKLLQELGGKHNLKVEIMSLRGTGEPGIVGPASSTKVRECLKLGKVKRIINYLDRPYALLVPRQCVRSGFEVVSTSAGQQHRHGEPAGTSSGSFEQSRGYAEHSAGAAEVGTAPCGALFTFHADDCLNQLPCDGRYAIHAFPTDVAPDFGNNSVEGELTVHEGKCAVRLQSATCIHSAHLRIDLLDSLRL